MSFTPEELELNESDDEQYYEEAYFDSDLDNETGEIDNIQSKPTDLIKKSRKKLTKEELFYDPEMDDDDEIWMKNKMAHVELDVKNDDMLEKSTTIKEEIYYPVECEICGIKVAVVDEEEVFHFFNVISS
ncbi:41080_t:CDS:2 [Gigaspora margarita]|uniref:41080_t:CDS:1 n=1 Tax=Gigaspora margarita TaxID=4874 RepID=A0ABN7UXV8_GIGMA|nr:41080_t:CDS:2 [Gigaspora margarita]